MFSNLSSSWISLATVTPSLVTRGPKDLSSATLRPLGPSVTRTALARISMPRSIFSRASTENLTSLAPIAFSSNNSLRSQSLDLDWFHSSTERVSNSRSGQAPFVRSSASTSAPMISLSFMIGYLRPSILNLRARPAHVGDALLGICLGRARWPRRQLKHRCFLTLAQQRQQYSAPVRKFERIVMRGQLVLVDLAKDGRLVVDCSLSSTRAGRPAGTQHRLRRPAPFLATR